MKHGYIAAVLILALALAGCGSTQPGAETVTQAVETSREAAQTFETTAAQESTLAPETEVPETSRFPVDDFTAACEDLLDHYRHLMALDHQACLEGQHNEEKFIDDLYEYHAYSLDPSQLDDMFFDTTQPHEILVHYGLLDVDKDGQQELFIGTSDNGGAVEVKRVFFYDGRKMSCISLELDKATCLKDGTIVIQAGNGGEVVGIMRFGDSVPVPAPEDQDFKFGFPQDYMAFEEAIQRRGLAMPESWQLIEN